MRKKKHNYLISRLLKKNKEWLIKIKLNQECKFRYNFNISIFKINSRSDLIFMVIIYKYNKLVIIIIHKIWSIKKVILQ